MGLILELRTRDSEVALPRGEGVMRVRYSLSIPSVSCLVCWALMMDSYSFCRSRLFRLCMGEKVRADGG